MEVNTHLLNPLLSHMEVGHIGGGGGVSSKKKVIESAGEVANA
jgi:hypothetical protein